MCLLVKLKTQKLFRKIDDFLVFLLLTAGENIRKVLLEAHEQGMGNGEHAFFGIELIKNRKKYGDLSWHKMGKLMKR